jgi:N-hydroxyarylamine O-acetyltransferase
MNCENYFRRIGYSGEPSVNFDTLRELHRKHLYSIPFENIDIHTGKNITLDINYIEEKVINSGRGGFCYELNGLFYELLREIGFDVKMVSANVFDEDEKPGAEFDHMALIVNIEGEEFIADVGFGDNFINPFAINPDMVNEDEAGFFQVVKEDEKYYKLLRSEDGVMFTSKYLFSHAPRRLSDYAEMCVYHQTNPKSHFVKNKLCSLANRGGRVTLVNDKLIITKEGKKEVSAIHGEEEFNENLYKYFKIKV